MRLAKEYFADQRDDDLKQLGKGFQRSDVPGHVTGKTTYFADRSFPGMLHLKMVRSPHDHARIRSIDTSEAEKHPGVARVLTHKDVPHNVYTILILIQVGPEDEQVLAADKVRWKGEAVVAVLADSERAAHEAARAEARRQSRYLAAHVKPTLSESSRYPERLHLLAVCSVFLFMLWSLGALIYYSLRDRR